MQVLCYNSKRHCFERNENPMAKKSAKSKGYRKTIKQKPFLTKKDIISLVIVVAVIALVVVLFNIFYDDGFIKANEVKQGDIVSYATSELRDRYKKIAEIGEIEGFTLAERDEYEEAISAYTFTPDAEVDNISSISVNGSFVSATTLVDTTLAYMSALTEDSTVSEVLTADIQGHEANIFAYTYSEYVEEETTEETTAEEAESTEEAAGETAEAVEPEDNQFTQAVSAYIAADDTHTLCFHIYRKGGDDSFYLADDQLVDFVQKYSTAFNMNLEEK